MKPEERGSSRATNIRSLLIANRGEIAVRVIRACRELDIRSVAVFSDADRGAMWARLADEAHEIGPGPAAQSYLNGEKLVAVALAAGVDAVHPGYGMLSENPSFAASVVRAGLLFVGPDEATIAVMGDKVAARRAAVSSGLPVLPGSESAIADGAEGRRVAKEIGFPVVVKASFGGGGRGMRVAHSPSDLEDALALAKSEAQKAFARGDVFIEKYLSRPRHVEVQVLGDRHGNIVHLGDRDCTVQRRHQKLLEEAPAPDLPDDLAADMREAAVRLCRTVGYVGAGTVEFLYDRAAGTYHFLEMNTRVQVEHGVTELVTGIDIVREQIRIADGGNLPFTQADIRIAGHAIQARISAEEPAEGFRPAIGRIEGLSLPGGAGVRCDFGVSQGDHIPIFYDSLFGKVHAWAEDRDSARARLKAALGELHIVGVPDTGGYLARVVEADEFAQIDHDTGSVERNWSPVELVCSKSISPDSATVPIAKPTDGRRVALPWAERSIGFIVPGKPGSNRGTVPLHGAEPAAPQQRQASDGRLLSPMPAVVSGVYCRIGQTVERGHRLFTLEAMKMELGIDAPFDGVVDTIDVVPGDTVDVGVLLASMRSPEQ